MQTKGAYGHDNTPKKVTTAQEMLSLNLDITKPYRRYKMLLTYSNFNKRAATSYS